MPLAIVDESYFTNVIPEDVPGIVRELVGRRAETYEVDELLTAGYTLANERARLLERAPYPLDIEFALSLLCRWPLKPKLDAGRVDSRRERGLYAARDLRQGSTTALEAMAPRSVLMLAPESLYRLLAGADETYGANA